MGVGGVVGGIRLALALTHTHRRLPWRCVRRAAHVDERAAIEFDAVNVQHAVTNPAVGVECLSAKVLRRCAKDYAGQDTVRQAQVRVVRARPMRELLVSWVYARSGGGWYSHPVRAYGTYAMHYI